jgi:hypothetical protein
MNRAAPQRRLAQMDFLLRPFLSRNRTGPSSGGDLEQVILRLWRKRFSPPVLPAAPPKR